MAHNYNLQQLHRFDFSAVMEATTDESKAVAWAMEVGLLERSMLCPQCAQPMRLNALKRYWRCCRKTRHADGKQEQLSIFVNSWFSKTIEGLWEMHIKRHIKAMRGCSKKYLDGYIDEYMWRSWFFPTRSSPGEFMCGLVQAVQRHPQQDE
ncbi:hypothetical protein DVH05_028551 [Phytophthora capsici]|nr:hypothetical protein DVH05_028551 [Phytophthora capsici]